LLKYAAGLKDSFPKNKFSQKYLHDLSVLTLLTYGVFFFRYAAKNPPETRGKHT
jgi:hypothetical protein